MRLLGDVTTNHCGAGHPWFRRALADPADGGYASWLGVPSLPTFDWSSTLLRRRFAEGSDAVLTRWLDRLDGWRVDVANMTGRRGAADHTWEVAALARRAVRKARPDALLVAEHAHDASGGLDREGWHGTMNYAGFLRPLWTWLGGAWIPPDFLGVPAPLPRRGAAELVATMRAFGSLASWQATTHSWTMVSSHDVARIRTVVGSPELVQVAVGLQMTLPGVPMVYAGDELGVPGRWAEDGRRPMPWQRPESWDRCGPAAPARHPSLPPGHPGPAGYGWRAAQPSSHQRVTTSSPEEPRSAGCAGSTPCARSAATSSSRRCGGRHSRRRVFSTRSAKSP